MPMRLSNCAHFHRRNICIRASSSQLPEPTARSRRPVRSKQFKPLHSDPEASDDTRSLLVQLHESQTDLLSAPSWAGASQQHHSLPPAYQQQLQLNRDETTPQNGSDGRSAAAGFYFSDQGDLFAKLHKRQQQHPTSANQLRSAGMDKLSVNYRYAIDDDGRVVDMVKTKRAVPATFQHAVPTLSALQRFEEDTTAYAAPQGSNESGSSSGRYLSDGNDAFDLLDNMQDSTPPVRPLCLKAFVYCVGQDELFNALWELDMADRVEWVRSLTQADVVIHRRPAPGEKQFNYDQYRRQARRAGIPFVSINAPTATELRKSLLPVYDIYLGKRSVPKGSRRIRL